MKIRDLMEHHGVLGNPFAEEDAQTDLVFKGYCVKTTFHSAWDKLYGNPAEPSTSIVFGEKGSGKTAIRLQMVRMLTEYNTDHPDSRPLVVDYADLNPFLDRFRNRFSRGRKIQKVLARWEIWDHLDAILSLGVTQLIDRILEPGTTSHPAAVDNKPIPIDKLNEHQIRDLLLLASCYDTSRNEPPPSRWCRLATKVGYRTWKSFFVNFFANYWQALFLGGGVSLTTKIAWRWAGDLGFLTNTWFYFFLLVFCLPFFWKLGQRFLKAWAIQRAMRVLPHRKSQLFDILYGGFRKDFSIIPFPVGGSTDNRYGMLEKFLGVSETLGFHGLIVIMDRVDEPYLINGSAELMKLLVWPILDNKLLKHERVGLKLLLPDQLLRFMEREDNVFHQRARIDKQNLIRSLDWTGESLLDLADARLKACAADGATPSIVDFFDPSLDRKRLIDAFSQLKVPRHLFKFLYKMFGIHVNAHTDSEPVWKISVATFESTLALYLRDRDAAERNLGVV